MILFGAGVANHEIAGYTVVKPDSIGGRNGVRGAGVDVTAVIADKARVGGPISNVDIGELPDSGTGVQMDLIPGDRAIVAVRKRGAGSQDDPLAAVISHHVIGDIQTRAVLGRDPGGVV